MKITTNKSTNLDMSKGFVWGFFACESRSTEPNRTARRNVQNKTDAGVGFPEIILPFRSRCLITRAVRVCVNGPTCTYGHYDPFSVEHILSCYLLNGIRTIICSAVCVVVVGSTNREDAIGSI